MREEVSDDTERRWRQVRPQSSVTVQETRCVSGAAGEKLETELNEEGPGTCLFVPCDVSKEDDIKVCRRVGSAGPAPQTGFLSKHSAATVSPQRLIAVTVERHGRIDCLVNNAGWRESTRLLTFSGATAVV